MKRRNQSVYLDKASKKLQKMREELRSTKKAELSQVISSSLLFSSKLRASAIEIKDSETAEEEDSILLRMSVCKSRRKDSGMSVEQPLEVDYNLLNLIKRVENYNRNV